MISVYTTAIIVTGISITIYNITINSGKVFAV